MRILIFGHVSIDINHSEHSSYVNAGGPAIFMQKIFRQLPDCHTTIIAPFGKDFLPYKKHIHFYPIDPVSEYNLVYENITKNNIRHQQSFHRENVTPVKINRHIMKLIKSADIIIVAPLVPNFFPDYLKQIAKHKSDKTMMVLLPQGYFRDFDDDNQVIARKFTEADQVLRYFQLVFVSDQDYPAIEMHMKKWVKKYQITGIITKGKKGATALAVKNIINLPTKPIAISRIVDSVGAGDVFAAGFTYKYLLTKDVLKAGDFANSIAGQKLFCTPDRITINYQ